MENNFKVFAALYIIPNSRQPFNKPNSDDWNRRRRWNLQNPSQTNIFCLYSLPPLISFRRDSLMTPPHFKHLSLYPPPPTPYKNYDPTHLSQSKFLLSIAIASDANFFLYLTLTVNFSSSRVRHWTRSDSHLLEGFNPRTSPRCLLSSN